MMNFKESCNTIVGYFLPNRKCFSFNGSLLFLLLILLAGIVTQHQAAARPNQDVELPPHDFNSDDEFRNVDNLEIHHVKMVDGVPLEVEDHPIIIYKEDFVSEDYVLPKNETKAEKRKRRYKDIGHNRRHRPNITDIVIEEKPAKVLFDILPEKPLIVPEEDMEKPRKSHMKLIPLLPQETIEVDQPNKDELNKRPKKFQHRIKRDTTNGGSHVLRKRNPYFRHVPKMSQEVPPQLQYVYVKHSVPGKKHNGLDLPVPSPTRKPSPNVNVPISFDNRVAADENDRVIFASGRPTSRPTSTTMESIFRDPRPENFDFSFMNPQRPATTTTTRTPIFTRRPPTDSPQPESIFRDPRPENFDFSFMNQGQQASNQQTVVASAPTSAPPKQTGISQCVWAIVNCCSNRSNEIRYSCFEQNGCFGAFWGLNPCADNVRDTFVNYVADYYN